MEQKKFLLSLVREVGCALAALCQWVGGRRGIRRCRIFFPSPCTDNSLNRTVNRGRRYKNPTILWTSFKNAPKEERKAWLNGIYGWAAGQSNVVLTFSLNLEREFTGNLNCQTRRVQTRFCLSNNHQHQISGFHTCTDVAV